MSGKIVAGVIQHPDSPDPNLVLNDDGTVDLFGGDGLGDVVGPVSSTDNALVRFDGTTGTVVQNSGITVDDSGNITSDVTIGKADATLTVGSGSGGGIHVVKGAAGQSRQVRMLTGTSRRWDLGANTTAEGGSSAGSDFVLTSHSDGGTQTAVVLATRSTGKVTLGAVGATAGLELGTSGPRVMSGTGSPESVVTAPVGSTWIDTAATTGAIKWIKATGTGNTGWVVQYGDTGLRLLTGATYLNSWTHSASNIHHIRRIGQWVYYDAWLTSASATAEAAYSIPSGFRPQVQLSLAGIVNPNAAREVNVASGGTVTIYYSGSYTHKINAAWMTTDTWPASLPGSAA